MFSIPSLIILLRAFNANSVACRHNVSFTILSIFAGVSFSARFSILSLLPSIVQNCQYTGREVMPLLSWTPTSREVHCRSILLKKVCLRHKNFRVFFRFFRNLLMLPETLLLCDSFVSQKRLEPRNGNFNLGLSRMLRSQISASQMSRCI